MTTATFKSVPTRPIAGQRPGTSGLRKRTAVFQGTNYTENYVQCMLSAMGDNLLGSHLVIGGDGRFYNKDVAQLIIRMAAANGVGKITMGQYGYMSTPALSRVIRKLGADGGMIMTASHNPGGPDNDYGIKFNMSNGGPAPLEFTELVYELSQKIQMYNTYEGLDCDLSTIKLNEYVLDKQKFSVDVIDPVADYVEMVMSIFDFPLIRNLLAGGFRILIDSMNAITGIYTKRIFVELLQAPPDSIRNAVPLEDFGGGHPDPNLTYAHELVEVMKNGDHDFGAAFDGDGDRNMILGKNAFFVTPSDSLAVLAANLDYIPYFKKTGVNGFARSMPTASAVDRVAEKIKKPIYETPTGWKFFGNLMDAGMLSLCGEESFGTGSDHIREKDGIWAVLSWLTIIAKRNKSVEEILIDHWKTYGRNFFTRYDYENCDSDACKNMMANLKSTITKSDFIGKTFTSGAKTYVVAKADDFEYVDPVDQSVASNQGLRIIFKDGSRIVVRLSGTGSSGSTVRLYIDSYENSELVILANAQVILEPLIQICLELTQVQKYTNRKGPTVIT